MVSWWLNHLGQFCPWRPTAWPVLDHRGPSFDSFEIKAHEPDPWDEPYFCLHFWLICVVNVGDVGEYTLHGILWGVYNWISWNELVSNMILAPGKLVISQRASWSYVCRCYFGFRESQVLKSQFGILTSSNWSIKNPGHGFKWCKWHPQFAGVHAKCPVMYSLRSIYV